MQPAGRRRPSCGRRAPRRSRGVAWRTREALGGVTGDDPSGAIRLGILDLERSVRPISGHPNDLEEVAADDDVDILGRRLDHRGLGVEPQTRRAIVPEAKPDVIRSSIGTGPIRLVDVDLPQERRRGPGHDIRADEQQLGTGVDQGRIGPNAASVFDPLARGADSDLEDSPVG